jgi:hypothetical protein|nr:MAG TPA: hypothetical protein [Caudoviricetes sp.]
MNLYGYPTIILKDKETGRAKREISCKNIQTIPARMMLSNVGYFEHAGKDKRQFGIGTRSGSNDNSSDIYTLPFRMPKTPFYYQNKYPVSPSYSFKFSDGQEYSSSATSGGVERVSLEKDSEGRSIIVFRGILNAPDSGIRKIGTICLSPRTTGPMFYTPLDDIIDQDATTVVDITYKVIVAGSTDKEYAQNFSSVYGFNDRDYSPVGRWSFMGNSMDGFRIPFSEDLAYSGGGSRQSSSALFTGMTDEKYNSVRPMSLDIFQLDFFNDYIFSSPLASSLNGYISRNNISTCGSFYGSLSYTRESSANPKDFCEITNEKGVTSTFSKRRENINSAIKPFFETTSVKKGTGAIKAISATRKVGLPERWEIDVIKGGALAEAEFRIRKIPVGNYVSNSNIQALTPIDHLSYYGGLVNLSYDKYNHPDGKWYEHSEAVWPLYGQNVAIVIRKGVLLTSIGNANYIILDETNLPHENRGIQITGIAWDDRKKGLLIGCGESGLYRVEYDNDTDTEPNVKRISNIGVEHVYAINGNGLGSVAMVTDAGIMYSNNLGETWSTKTFETVKTQMANATGFNSSTNWEPILKNQIVGFILSRDGLSVGICTPGIYYGSEIPFIKLSDSSPSFRLSTSSNLYSNDSRFLGENAPNGRYRYNPICIPKSIAEQKRKSLKDLISSDGFIMQPGSYFGISVKWGEASSSRNYGFAIANCTLNDRTRYNVREETKNSLLGELWTFVSPNSSVVAVTRDNYASGDHTIIHNGRWGLALVVGSSGRVRTEIVGPEIGTSKDVPANYYYYDSTTSSFVFNQPSKVVKLSGQEMIIDGVKLSITDGRFEKGDCFIFHRTTSYLDDNVSTMNAYIERSILDKSNWLEQSGTISEEMPKPLYRNPLSICTNMYRTQDNRLKTKDRTATFYNDIEKQPHQFKVQGSSKMKIDASRLKGTFLIDVILNPGQRGSGATIIISKTDAGVSYHCMNDYLRKEMVLSDTQVLKSPSELSIVIDSDKRGITVNDGARVIWTSGSFSSSYAQDYYISIVPLSTRKSGKYIQPYLVESTERGDDLSSMNDEAELFIPTFEYAYKGVLCTRLGNEGLASGSYDPLFFGLPSVASLDAFIVEIDGKRAEVVPSVHTTDAGKYARWYKFKPERPARGGVSAKANAGQVLIDTYTGMVYFSDEDIGKPYKIKYKYYKGDILGVGEVILE